MHHCLSVSYTGAGQVKAETYQTHDGFMVSSREYPHRPVVGIAGVVIDKGTALLVRRGSEPLRGEWSIPGGNLELGETLEEGVARELLEETRLVVRAVELIEVFERIVPGETDQEKRAPRFHYVIADYLCECISGEATAASDVTEVAFVREAELGKYDLTEAATRVLHKAFAMDRARRNETPDQAKKTAR